MVEFRITVLDAAGNVLGPGPIITATDWESTLRMDRAGQFRFAMPASDPKASLIVEKRRVLCDAYISNTWVEVGDGIINQIDTTIADDGAVMLSVSGPDGMGELAGYTTGFLDSRDISFITTPLDVAVHLLYVHLPAEYGATDWQVTASQPDTTIYARFMGESVLSALGKMAAENGYHFRYDGAHTLGFFESFEASGVRAIQARGPLAAETCAITSLSRSVETHDLITRMYPFGAGNAFARLNLAACTRAVPAGYTASFVDNYIEASAAAAAYGRIDRWIEFKDITPLSNTDADLEAAANYLFDVAKLELDRSSERLTRYDLTVAQCSQVLRPGQTIRTIYRDSAAGLAIDEELNILESTLRIDPTGLRTVRLTVTDGDRWPSTDAEIVTNQIAESRTFQSHPQLNANAYVQSYSKNVDEVETATFRFRFGSEVTQLNQVLFEFELLPMESTVKTIAVESQTGGSGELETDEGGAGATTQPDNNTSGTPSTNTSGGPSVDSSGLGGAGTTGSGGSGTSGSGGGGTSGSGGGGSTGASGTGSTGAGGAGSTGGSGSGSTGSGGSGSTDSASGSTSNDGDGSTSGPEGGDTESAGQHYHRLNIIRTGDPASFGYAGVYVDVLSDQLYTTGAGDSVNPFTQNSGDHEHNRGDHTHAIGGHSHDIGSHDHTFGDHTHTLINHTHTFGDHTHTTTAHTHSVTAHTHSIAAHTHTLSDHTHSMGAHTHSLGGHSHDLSNHTHSLSNHTHTLTPQLTTIYGIFRESTLNTYGVGELEYRVNSGSWLPLSGALAVGGGWFRLDVTGSLYNATTFRPLSEANTVQIRSAQQYTITRIGEILGTPLGLAIEVSPPPTVLAGQTIRVAGTGIYNGDYTVQEIIGNYIVTTAQITGPLVTTGTLTLVKRATIDAQLSVRNIIQALSYI